MKAIKDQRAGNKEEKGERRKAGRRQRFRGYHYLELCAGLVFTSNATQNAREKGGRGPEGGGSPS